MASIIELKNVSFRYGREPVLDGVSFSVNEGDYVGIIGPNGGGKTTLLKIITGLLRPTGGEALLFGENAAAAQSRVHIGYVPQRATQRYLNFPATVEEIVRSGRTAKVGFLKRFGAEDKRKVKEALEALELWPMRSRPIGELSGGELQKVFLARALAGEPKVLILDEPETGLDAAAQEKFYSFMDALNRERRMTVLFISHDIELISHAVQKVLCLNRRMLCFGSPREFIKEEYIDRLYGKKVKFIFHEHKE